MKHYTLISHVADALAQSTALVALMAPAADPEGEGEGTPVVLTIQIGEDLQNPTGMDKCPIIVISSSITDCINGRDPKTHRLNIYAMFNSSSADIATTEPAELPAVPEDPPAWIDPTRRVVYGCVGTADSICDAIRDAISAKLDALAKAGTAGMILKTISRDVDSEMQFPLVVAANMIEIEDSNPTKAS